VAEKDYIAIAKRKVTKPSQQKDRGRKLLVYARNKKGKTTFGLSAGIQKTLVLDPERGTDPFVQADPHTWHIEKWQDMQEAYGALRTGQLSPKLLGHGPSDKPYTWVLVDGLTRLNNMALRYVMSVAEERDLDRKPGMVDRRDYNKSGELMKQMLTNFHNLKMGVIYTAQERMETSGGEDDEEGESSVFYVPDLPKGVRGTVNSLVDVIGRLYVTTVTVKLKGGGTKDRPQRRLWIGDHERYDTGYRSDFSLPPMIKDPTVPKLVNLMLTGDEAS
jgi:hypothetical protein